MKAIHVKRLLRLAEVLEAVPRSEFDMGHFLNSQCGTPACALGHYAASRNFRAPFARVRRPGGFGIEAYFTPVGSWFEAAEKHFGLDDLTCDDNGRTDVSELFEHDGCGGAKTPKQAAKYIRKFVARKQAEAA